MRGLAAVPATGTGVFALLGALLILRARPNMRLLAGRTDILPRYVALEAGEAVANSGRLANSPPLR